MSKTVIEIKIANVTANDTGEYKVYDPLGVRHGWDLNVSELSFIGQTDIQTIVGQEGKEMTITCFSDTDQYITALRLELNGTAVALGDNQTVDFKFKPDRKDHLSRYKCEDVIQSSITIEVKLIVTCPPENRNVQTGEVGKLMKLSFHIYSYPPIEEIFMQQIGRKQSKRKKIINVNILTSILAYTKFANTEGIEGYEISVEYRIIDKDDFQSYCITATNRLGETNHYFIIIDDESLPLSKRNKTYFVILCSVAAILFIYIITSHTCFCVRHYKTIAQRHTHISEDHSDQIDDELSSISFRANNNVSSSNTNNEHDHSSAQTRPSNISVGVNHQSTDESESFATSELPSNFKSTDAQEQRVSIPSSLSNVFNTDDSGILSIENAENCNKINATVISNALSNKNNQTSMESDSESSNNVTVGSDGDGYDNPYETISQEREESHQYTMMSKERHNSFSSIEYHCKDDRLGTTNAKEAIYINLQF
ncbi:Hypothetical predicted protein [Mytilus galloprovincialis]|uniref:Uncharacterized protein n=1 Tax=Mytilus galloprovincialis TaxID=29158 RepID=A0A8B6FKS3_MYTGA|nr:Hypothetical predicted protein [Mytilus galloprovincialis]